MLPHLRAAGLVCAWLESDGCDGPQMAVVELRKSFRPQKLKKKGKVRSVSISSSYPASTEVFPWLQCWAKS